MKRSLGICSIILVICMVLTNLSVIAFAEGEVGSVYKVWNMEANGGIVTYLQFSGNGASASNEPVAGALQNGILHENRNGVPGIGIDGSYAATYGSVSNNGLKYFIALTDQAKIQNKAGYTYFKSAMMRLNPEAGKLIPAIEGKKLDTTKKLTAFNEIGGKGFAARLKTLRQSLLLMMGQQQSKLMTGTDWMQQASATL